MESQLRAGVACSTCSKVHIMLYEGEIGGLLFTIDLGGPLTPVYLPLLLLHALRSKQSIQ